MSSLVVNAPLQAEQLYPRLASFVRGALARLGVREADLDDVTQDVFITLHRKGCTFEDERSARAWLYATARRIASNERRSRRRAEDRLPGWTPAEPPCPETALQHREAAQVVEQFAAGLPEGPQQVFHLSEVEGLAAPQIARRLGLNLNTTYSLIRRVRQRFARSAAIGIGLLLLLLAALCGACSTEGDHDLDHLALRAGANLAG